MSTATGILTIDLKAVQANWRFVRDQLSALPAAVIKADAYGLGAEPVGAALYRAGCREFFLATLEEALAARSYLPSDACLYVLGGAREGEEREFFYHRLIPVLSSFPAVERWAQACQKADQLAGSALKFDTGMTRLGLSEVEWHRLQEAPSVLKGSNPVLWMSHLACADEYGHSLNRIQQQRFSVLCKEARRLFPGIRCSLANSSGIFLGSDWHFDLARTGAALYGFEPHPGRSVTMQSVVRLELPILQCRELASKSAIGYGATEYRPKGTRLAVVAGGYADGLNRTIGKGAWGRVGGIDVPVVGRISMDTTIFDISRAELPGEPESGYITVVDEKFTVGALTERAGALGYEVLTSLGSRYRRRYLG